MIVYLDQNKWIELARIANGLDTTVRDKNILGEFLAASKSKCIFPLASTHFIEFSRIGNVGRRKRLGELMWKISKDKTFAPYPSIVEREIEVALRNLGIDITPRPEQLIGEGVEFAFGVEFQSELLKIFKALVNKSILTGSEMFDIDPVGSVNLDSHRNNFFKHLSQINEKKHQLDKSKWDDWLHAISMVDIIDPLNRVFQKYSLSVSLMEKFSKEQRKEFLMSMPTRKLDIHLHRQVLKNEQYKPKKSDLEDWGGIGVASCYCDVVVCEKHFASLLNRDGYIPKARVVTKLDHVFKNIA